MDHNDNLLRIKIKIRNINAVVKVDDYDDDDTDCKKQFCSIDHMRFDSETKMKKGLLFQSLTPVTTATRRSSPSPCPATDFVDCSKFLHSWPVTGRRGRKSTSSATSSTITTDTTVDVISSDRLDTKRVKTETRSKLPKKKVCVKENKNNGVLEKEYKCNICSKVFTSPRALGGHKSSHYKANKRDIAIKKETPSATIATTFEPKITVSSVDSSTDRKRLVMDLNLNELPPDDDDRRSHS